MEKDCIPTLRGEIKKARNSNYDFKSSVFEFLDNALDTGCTQIKIDVKDKMEEDLSHLHKIMISDNYEHGISRSILLHIFSWTYERTRQRMDIGEFGTGFKCAAVNLGHSMSILTYDKVNQQYWKVIADWDSMEESDRFLPQLIEIHETFYRDYHPFDQGTTFIIENLRHGFFQHARNKNLMDQLLHDICEHYKYYLRSHPHLTIRLKGTFLEGKIEKCLDEECIKHYFFFDACPVEISSRIYVYRDQANYYNFFISKNNSNKIEMVEYVETRKNGNHHLKSSEITNRILISMVLVDEMIFKSCFYLREGTENTIISCGSVDIFQNDRMVGRNISFRQPRNDAWANYIKHEIHLTSKSMNHLVGIQFNKKSHAYDLDNDLRYTLEYLQMYHEKEMIRVEHKHQTFEQEIQSIPTIEAVLEEPCPKIIEHKIKRKNFSLETKLNIIKNQECRDSDFDFLLKDDILPFDYDHKNGHHSNNSMDNCQALSVISHALKTRKPNLYQSLLKDKGKYITELLNCITSSDIFLQLFQDQKIKFKPMEDISLKNGIFSYCPKI